MTTHRDRQLGQNMMKYVESPMIPRKEGMPQCATRKGQQLGRKIMKPVKGLMILGKEGMS